MQNNNPNQIVSAIIIAGALIAGAILLKGSSSPAPTGAAGTGGVQATNSRPITSTDHIMGDRNAKIVILEYSDLECPYCKVFHETMLKVVNESNGKVAWVFRHYPIPQLHPKAFKEAEATECAYDQGGNDAFWKYTNRLFEITPANNGLDAAKLPEIAASVGLNVASFNDCLASGKFTAKVQADIDDGVKAGVNGTPSSFILQKGKVIDTIPGAQPFESVMKRLGEIK